MQMVVIIKLLEAVIILILVQLGKKGKLLIMKEIGIRHKQFVAI